jgi:hypothetical protein
MVSQIGKGIIMRASPKTTKTNAPHNHGRSIRVTKHDSTGRIIAAAEVSTLEAAHRFLDSLNSDGTMKAPAKPSKPIPAPGAPTLGEALMQATPTQQQQAKPDMWQGEFAKRVRAEAEAFRAANPDAPMFGVGPGHGAVQVACPTCGGLQWVSGTNLRPQPCRACHGSGKAVQS